MQPYSKQLFAILNFSNFGLYTVTEMLIRTFSTEQETPETDSDATKDLDHSADSSKPDQGTAGVNAGRSTNTGSPTSDSEMDVDLKGYISTFI